MNAEVSPNQHDRYRVIGLRHRVRFHGVHFVASSWSRISRTSRALLFISVVFVGIQIVTTIVALTIGRNQTCDKPLRMYLIVYLTRVVIACPLFVYQHLHPPSEPQSRHVLGFGRHQPPPTTATTAPVATTESPSPSPSPSTQSNAAPSPSPSEPASQPSPTIAPSSSPAAESSPAETPSTVSIWVDRFQSTKHCLDIFAVAWFILGNNFLFTSSNCLQGAPTLFDVTLVWVLLGYIPIVIPIFLCIAVLCCLPHVLVAMQAMNMTDAPGMTGGNKEEVTKIPIYRFVAGDTDHHHHQQQPQTESPSSSPVPNSPSARDQRGPFALWKKFQHRRRTRIKSPDSDPGTETAYPNIHISPIEDAVCSICLAEYEQDDLVCKLWCSHHFHKDCVHKWLVLNSKCPLCMQDFRGKGFDEEDAPDEATQ